MKSFHFSLGNSSDGPVGFCARVKASSKQAAIDRLKRALPVELDVRVDSENDEDVEYVQVYFNPEAITAAAIDEVNAVEGVEA